MDIEINRRAMDLPGDFPYRNPKDFLKLDIIDQDFSPSVIEDLGKRKIFNSWSDPLLKS